MVGKIVGVYIFKSKGKEGKPPKEWAKVMVQQDFPEESVSAGVRVDSVLCSPDRLPEKTLKDMINHKYHISTNNNFASEFYKVE